MDYSKLNPGVQKLVKFLNESGFKTVDSGDGETHEFKCDRGYAYVCIQVPAPNLIIECERLKEVLNMRGIKIDEVSPEKGVNICGTYDPVNKIGMIDLIGITDADLEKSLI